MSFTMSFRGVTTSLTTCKMSLNDVVRHEIRVVSTRPHVVIDVVRHGLQVLTTQHNVHNDVVTWGDDVVNVVSNVYNDIVQAHNDVVQSTCYVTWTSSRNFPEISYEIS